MRDAITALEAALGELENARDGLPDDLRTELEAIISQARSILTTLEGATADSDPADAPG